MGTHPANLIPPLTTKHASALSVDGTPSLARCRDSVETDNESGSPKFGIKIENLPNDSCILTIVSKSNQINDGRF